MAKLFNKIRQKLVAEKPSANRTSNYLKYAIGEIVLVVIGILIALAVAEWNSNRRDIKTEHRFLNELHQAINKDMQLIASELESTKKAMTDLTLLVSLLKQEVPKPTEKLFQLFGTVYGLKTLNLNKALYEDLKSIGFGIIQDEKLRTQIITVFENHYKDIENIKDNERSVNQVNRPYYLKNFTSIRFSDYAKPNDLNILWNDFYYHNIVYYRLVTLEYNQKAIYTRTLKDLQVLLKLIERNSK